MKYIVAKHFLIIGLVDRKSASDQIEFFVILYLRVWGFVFLKKKEYLKAVSVLGLWHRQHSQLHIKSYFYTGHTSLKSMSHGLH